MYVHMGDFLVCGIKAFFKIGIFQDWHFSRIGIFQELAFFKNWHFSRIGIFQELAFFKNWHFSRMAFFKIGIFQDWHFHKFKFAFLICCILQNYLRKEIFNLLHSTKLLKERNF